MTSTVTKPLRLGALLAIFVLAGSSVVFATATTNLFFNINASDSGSYSASTPRAWNDLSTNARNGAVVGTTGLTYNGTTKALEFPGGTNSTNSLGYVDMGDGFNNFGSGITIEFEGHFGAANLGWERVFDFGNGPASDNIWVGVFGETGRQNSLAIEIFHGSTGKNRCISAGNILVANTFAKWAITLDGATCRMYKDGVEVDTEVGQVTMTNDSSSLGSAYPSLPLTINRTENYIGRSNWGLDPAFDGALKYVRIYTSALSAADITANATTYTLTYATSGFDSGTAPAAVTGNGLITLTTNTGNLVKAGHTFGGWATSAGQTTAISGSYNLTANITLHPVWIPDATTTIAPPPVVPAPTTSTTVSPTTTTTTTPSTSALPSRPRQGTGFRTAVLDGFTPGETVELVIGPNGKTRTVTADETGTVRFTVRLRSTDDGSVQVRASGRTRVVRKEIRLTDPPQMLPATGTTNASHLLLGALLFATGAATLRTRRNSAPKHNR